ncbi:MAG: DUF4838 domain-containing protein [Lentisphaerae bacterium]|nr:DUF4838 domain-containing protein [Lentisphaerota bacterium]
MHATHSRKSPRSFTIRCFSGALLVVLLLTRAGTLYAQTPFFADGQTSWRVYLAATSAPAVRYAVEELTNALKQVSGADFPVQQGGEVPASGAIVVGDLTDPLIAGLARELKLEPGEVEQSAVKTIDERLFLAGNQPRGALYAVYGFLNQQLGVRWLWPGESGTFMPPRAQWTLPQLAQTHTPGYPFRGFHLCGDWRDHQAFRRWMARNFVNVHRHAAPVAEQRLGFHSMYSSHNAHLRADRYFADHPDYFAEIDGKRYPSSICMSHPEVLAEVARNLLDYLRRQPQIEILSIFPSDNQDYCRCADCAKMDLSTAWFTFYNRLTDRLKAEYPRLKFATIAYQGYREVPAVPVRNTLFVEYATYGRCNAHPFSDTNCTRNAHVLQAFDAWEKTGVPVGNYGYEFDVFRRNACFTPFFTMIEDAIREGHRRGQAALITEVVLSPRTGPVTSVLAVQNRLPTYLYAQLMWDPSRAADELLADWCRTAYGDAAAPMLDYFRAMGESWTDMDRHPGILGDAMSVADAFVTEALQTRVERAFDQAAAALVAQAPSAWRDRAQEAVAREQILYKQWRDLADQKRGGVPLVNAPRLDTATNLTDAVCQPVRLSAGDPATAADVRVAWSRDALLIRWRCGEPQPGELRAQAAARDQGVLDDDAVEAEVTVGLSGESACFAVNSRGVQADVRRSTVGVMEPQWNPDWAARVAVGDGHWDVVMEIPFTALGAVPNPGDSWQFSLRRTFGGRAGRAPARYPQSMPAILYFNPSATTGHQVLYWSGAPAREQSQDAARRQQFMQAGWEMHVCSTQATLLAAHPLAEAFWFRHPHGPVKVPEGYWRRHLVPAVSNGAVAVFVSYWGMPLDRYFDDPSFKVAVTSITGLPLSGRRTTWLAPGAWGRQPFDVARSLAHGYSPCYGFIPADTNAWTILAVGNNGGGRPPYPYLLARRYGKGLVVVGGDAIPARVPELLDNLVHWNRRLRAALPDGELRLDPAAIK